MAFVSMMFIFGVIAVIVLGTLFIAGLIFLIVGIVKKRKYKGSGKKYPVVFIVIGALLLALPVTVTGAIVVGGVSSAVSAGIKRMEYESVTDKWRNEWTTDNSAAAEAIEALLTSADSGDREAFAKMFTPNIQKSADFQIILDEFFSAYPVGLSGCDMEDNGVSSSGSYNYGSNVQKGSTRYTGFLDGKWYCLYLSFCYENTDSPDDVGVTFFSVENLEANALDKNYSDSEYLVCEIKSSDEVSARLIDNMAFVFEPHPERSITAEEMKGYIKKYNNVYRIADEIGDANVRKKYSNATGTEFYYELAPVGGEPRYAHICADGSSGKIFYGFLCSDTKTIYDEKLIEDEK